MTCCSLVFQTTGTTNTQVPAPDHGHVSLTNKDMLPTKPVTLYSTFPDQGISKFRFNFASRTQVPAVSVIIVMEKLTPGR